MSESDSSENSSELISPSCSPPSYTLVESRDGSMISRHFGVKYPERPKTGYYSHAEHLKRKSERKRKEQNEGKTSEQPEKKSEHEEHQCPSTAARVFVGIMATEKLKKRIEPDEILLFYPIAENGAVPVSLHLHLAHRNTEEVTVTPLLHVDGHWSMENGHRVFSTLSSLVDYYQLYRSFNVGENTTMYLPSASDSSGTDTLFEEEKEEK